MTFIFIFLDNVNIISSNEYKKSVRKVVFQINPVWRRIGSQSLFWKFRWL